MSIDDEIVINPELSADFRSFEEFCDENSGSEKMYLELIAKNPTVMDSVTIAFCIRRLVKLSKEFADRVLFSVKEDEIPDLTQLLGTKGIQLDKNHSGKLREIIFAFRDSDDEQIRAELSKAFTLITLAREKKRVVFNVGESYKPPDEGWLAEDFDGDDTAYEMVRAVENPQWSGEEEI